MVIAIVPLAIFVRSKNEEQCWSSWLHCYSLQQQKFAIPFSASREVRIVMMLNWKHNTLIYHIYVIITDMQKVWDNFDGFMISLEEGEMEVLGCLSNLFRVCSIQYIWFKRNSVKSLFWNEWSNQTGVLISCLKLGVLWINFAILWICIGAYILLLTGYS